LLCAQGGEAALITDPNHNRILIVTPGQQMVFGVVTTSRPAQHAGLTTPFGFDS
jgi:hypothetical protein